jgi:putative hydrolase of the HAD superfamily
MNHSYRKNSLLGASSLCTYRLVGTIRCVAERSVDAVVFDYGGVLTAPVRTSTKQWLAAEGIDVDGFYLVMREWMAAEAELGSPVHQLETGELTGEDFSQALAVRLRTEAGLPVSAEGLLGRMLEGLVPDPEMDALVEDVRATGVRVGLLSNSWGNTYPEDIATRFDPVVISGEVGLRKPDPRIYEVALDALAIAPERVAFVDDMPVNVAAATELGIHAVRHTDASATRSALAELLPELAA